MRILTISYYHNEWVIISFNNNYLSFLSPTSIWRFCVFLGEIISFKNPAIFADLKCKFSCILGSTAGPTQNIFEHNCTDSGCSGSTGLYSVSARTYMPCDINSDWEKPGRSDIISGIKELWRIMSRNNFHWRT